MTTQLTPQQVRLWMRSVLIVFLVMGLGFGTWLSRLPAVRDHLDASTLEMSIYGLSLATGSLVGLITTGQTVSHLGPRRVIVIGGIVQAVALPTAAAVLLSGSLVPGLSLLFIYGYMFATVDVAMNVTGASAERALGRPRMPLLHAAYSLGGMVALGIGALAETFGVPVPIHFAAMFAAILTALLTAVRWVPSQDGERDKRHQHSDVDQPGEVSDQTGSIPIIMSAEGQLPAFTAMTGSIPIITPAHYETDGERSDADQPDIAQSDIAQPDAADPEAPGTPATPPRRYSAWRDRRVLLIGAIGLSTSIAEGTASDWLPLSLVDGRDLSNENAALMLAVFFISMMAARLSGSLVLTRFGRVAVLRASAILCAAGITTLILVPSTLGIVLGTIGWGLGSSLGFPVAVSAAADNQKTAVHDVAVVAAISYVSMFVGPMAFGFLGQHIGLLTSFWVLTVVALLGGAIAGAAREPGRFSRRSRHR